MQRSQTVRSVGLAVLITACLIQQAEAKRPKYVTHPTLTEIRKGLGDWAQLYPKRMKVETVGRSTDGHPMLMAIVTDQNVSDEDKQVVLLWLLLLPSQDYVSLLHLRLGVST